MQKILAPVLFALALVADTLSAEQSQPDEQVYKEQYIRLFETEATRIDTYAEKNIPAVRFSVKNLGTETLTKVQVIVFFLDEQGQPFYEESYYPVLVSDYSIGSDNKPLKPNYTFRLEEGRYYTIKNLGDEWSGKVEYEIGEIEFAD